VNTSARDYQEETESKEGTSIRIDPSWGELSSGVVFPCLFLGPSLCYSSFWFLRPN
jgi:hypothetical protein